MDWKHFLKLVYSAAKLSKDPSTQNAAFLINYVGVVMAWDINRFPENVKENQERWQRPLKYKFIEHAERNVIYKAARRGIKTEGLIMVCPWSACSDCARAIIQAGVEKLVNHKQAIDHTPDYWAEDIKIASMMLCEAKIDIVNYDGKIDAEEILLGGQLWKP